MLMDCFGNCWDKPQEEWYHQCTLEKVDVLGKRIRVGWIPSQYAQLNRILSLKINEKWDKNWKVVHVGQMVYFNTLENLWERYLL